MTTSISSEALKKKNRKLKNERYSEQKVEKRTKWVIDQMFGYHKKLKNEEKHFIETYETVMSFKA